VTSVIVNRGTQNEPKTLALYTHNSRGKFPEKKFNSRINLHHLERSSPWQPGRTPQPKCDKGIEADCFNALVT
jgi:hypothetical protein